MIVSYSSQHLSTTLLWNVGWKKAYDARSGNDYYYNKALGRSQFEHPMPEESPPLPPPPLPLQEGTKVTRSSPPPQPCFVPQEKDYLIVGLKAKRAKLRAMLPCVSGDRKTELLGDLAAVESEILAYI